MRTPKISAIIPIYGVEKYIERCARSLFEQTQSDLEFIFVDDCTPDNSMKILDRIIEEYRPRFAGNNWVVRIEKMSTNSGQAAVRRHGIQLATGEYIIHCDSDDWVEPDMYRLLYESAQSNGADMAVCDYFRNNGVNQKVYEVGCHSTNITMFIENIIRHKDSWVVWNKLIKSSYYKSVNFPVANMGEDMVYMLQLAFYIKKVAYVPQPLYNYFFNPTSITNSKTEEKIYNNFISVVSNINVIQNFYIDKETGDVFNSNLNYLKWTQRDVLLPLLNDRKYYKIWRSIFPGIEIEILRDKNQKLRDRFKCLLTVLYIYPWNRFFN